MSVLPGTSISGGAGARGRETVGVEEACSCTRNGYRKDANAVDDADEDEVDNDGDDDDDDGQV